MKKLILLVILMLLILQAEAQFSFGINTNFSQLPMPYNNFYVGYKFNRIEPVAGLHFIQATFDYQEDYVSPYDPYYSHTSDVTFKGSIFMPHAGVKFYIVNKNDLKAYIVARGTIPIISQKYIDIYNGNIYEYTYSDDIKSKYAFGADGGFGAEYFFADKFSIGAEAGVLYANAGLEYDYTSMKGNLSYMYSALSVNFYFTDKKNTE